MIKIFTASLLIALCAVANAAGDGDGAGNSAFDLDDLSFEELLDVEVISAGKKSQKISSVAAAIFVISRDDIERSGATTIPEALRMAPGLAVRQIDGNKWSVGSRGFGGRFSTKLLVLIDGRSVYTPSFSGVYWETHDLVMEDVDRIEVIRGPGATLWGANAVNGVINIITRPAQETEHGLMVATAGTEEKETLLRYGGAIGHQTSYRLFGKLADRDQFITGAGLGAGDDWRLAHLGWRVDSVATSGDQLTLQGDLIDSQINQQLGLPSLSEPYEQVVADEVQARAWNVLGRWRRPLSLTAEISVQLFLDHNQRSEAYVSQRHDTVDFEFQHRLQASARQDLVWGVGFRRIGDRLFGRQQITFRDSKANVNLWSAFAQNEIELVRDRLGLTVGAKIEHNERTGTETQPNVRLIWTPSSHQSFWAAISQAVRTPSRAEVNANVWGSVTPPFFGQNTSPFPVLVSVSGLDMVAEELSAYEMGFRFAPSAGLNFDVALFNNHYDNLRTSEAAAPVLVDFSYVDVPLTFANQGYSKTRGVELTSTWQPNERVYMQLAFSHLDIDFSTRTFGTDFENKNVESASPENQLSLRTSLAFSDAINADLWVRYTSAILATGSNTANVSSPVDAYWDLDMVLKWQPTDNLALRLVGKNLLDASHAEAYREAFSADAVRIPRGFYASVSWAF